MDGAFLAHILAWNISCDDCFDGPGCHTRFLFLISYEYLYIYAAILLLLYHYAKVLASKPGRPDLTCIHLHEHVRLRRVYFIYIYNK